MTSWNDGYVSDIEYLPGYYMEQAPAHLDAVCLLRNQEPPRQPGEPFRYCELGCGIGETALTIAAANHHSEVWGFDFNPAHIARGRQRAVAAGLTNVRLEEASFEQLARERPFDLPAFDYITLHGVWTWVSPVNRAHIVDFIDRHLKPGGLVYVTYNALPAWTEALPIQRMLNMLGSLGHESSDMRVSAAVSALRQFAQAGAASLPGEYLDRLEKERDQGNVSYLSHEYLNDHWQPAFQVDVALDMADAKLEFVGTANLLENFPELSVTAEQRALIEQAPPAMRETLKDYFMARSFRRDVYVRGVRTIPERRRDGRLRAHRLALAIPSKLLTRDVRIPLGKATLSEGFYGPALEALAARGVVSVGELLDLPEAAGATANAREVIGMLIGSRQAMAADCEVSEEARAAARAYNAMHLASCADDGRAVTAIAAPVTGSGITVTIFEMLAYEALMQGTAAEPEALTQAAWKLLRQRGDKLRFEGAIIEDEQENLTKLRENMEKIVSAALPLWQRVGAF